MQDLYHQQYEIQSGAHVFKNSYPSPCKVASCLRFQMFRRVAMFGFRGSLALGVDGQNS